MGRDEEVALRISRESPTPEYPRLRWVGESSRQSRPLHIRTSSPEYCHPEFCHPEQRTYASAATKKLHRYFVAKNAAQHDSVSGRRESFRACDFRLGARFDPVEFSQ